MNHSLVKSCLTLTFFTFGSFHIALVQFLQLLAVTTVRIPAHGNTFVLTIKFFGLLAFVFVFCAQDFRHRIQILSWVVDFKAITFFFVLTNVLPDFTRVVNNDLILNTL